MTSKNKKPSQRPSMKEFEKLLAEARRQAREAGLKRSDITKAIKEVRAEKASKI